MTWTTGGPIGDGHTARLLAAGVEPDVLDGLSLVEVTRPLPEWWAANGNALYVDARMVPDGRLAERLPRTLVDALTPYPFSDALLVLGCDVRHLALLLVGGDRPTVFLGPRVVLTAGEIFCGADSTVVLNGDVIGTRQPFLDARNGGSIVTAPDQLWAADVYLATDDMHRLEDLATGARLNPYGAHIRLGHHVWLGRQAVLTGHVEVGDGSVVGMRAMLRNDKVAPHTAVGGVPARVLREGVSWRSEDTP